MAEPSLDCDLLGPIGRETLAAFCRLLYARGLAVAADGNVSVRTAAGFLTTPTGVSLRDLRPEHFVLVEADGRVAAPGLGAPSKELAMHLGIFAVRPEVAVVCHVHGAFITSVATLLPPGPDSLPPITPGQAYYASPLPMLPVYIPGSPELAAAVGAAFREPDLLALLLKNHGLITVGATLADAVNLAEEVDEAARIYIHTQGRADPLGAEAVATLRRQRRTAGGGGA